MSTQTLVINLSRDATVQVAVRDKDDNLTHVQIVPRGRVNLEVGTIVDPRYASMNEKKLKIVLPTEPINAPDASSDGGTA